MSRKPSHGSIQCVNYELYRDQDTRRETKYLRAIVYHLRPPLPVKPKPQVRDPAVVLRNCNLPRNIFRSGTRTKDGTCPPSS